MSERKTKSVKGKLTPAQRRRHTAIRQRVEQDKPRLTRQAEAKKAELIALHEALAALKREREARGLSLGDVSAKCGIDKSALAKLEKSPHANPTITTLTRIAEAIGVKLAITVSAA